MNSNKNSADKRKEKYLEKYIEKSKDKTNTVPKKTEEVNSIDLEEADTGETLTALQELSQRNRKLRDLENNLEETRKEYSGMDRKLRSEEKILEAREKSLDKKLDDIQRREAELKEKSNALSKEKEYIDKSFEEQVIWETRREGVYQELLIMEEELKDREKRAEDYEKRILQKERNLDNGLNALKELESREKKVKTKEDAIIAWEANKKRFEENLRQESEKIQEQNKTIQTKKNELDKREESLKEMEQRTAQLSNNINTMKKELDDEKKRSERLESLVNKKNQELIDMTEKIERTMSGLNKRIALHEEKSSNLEKELANEKNQNERMAKEYQTKIKGLETSIDLFEKEKKEKSIMDSEMNTLKSQMDSGSKAIEQKNNEIRIISNNLEKALHHIDSLKVELEKERRNTFEAGQGNLKDGEIAKDLDSAMQTIESLKIELEKTENQKDAEMREKDKQCQGLGHDLERTLRQIDLLKNQLELERSKTTELERKIEVQRHAIEEKPLPSESIRKLDPDTSIKPAEIQAKQSSATKEMKITQVKQAPKQESPAQRQDVKLPTSGTGERRTEIRRSSISTYTKKSDRNEKQKVDGKYRKVPESSAQITVVNPNDLEALLAAGEASNKKGRHDKAIEYFDAALKIEKNEQRAILGLAEAYYQQEKYGEAVKFFDKLLSMDKLNEKVWVSKGNSLYNLYIFDGAEKCYRNALKLNPSSVDGLVGLGYVYYSQNKFEESMTIAKKIYRQEPKNPLGQTLMSTLTSDAILK